MASCMILYDTLFPGYTFGETEPGLNSLRDRVTAPMMRPMKATPIRRAVVPSHGRVETKTGVETLAAGSDVTH